MEKIELYKASIEIKPMFQAENISEYWYIVGLFVNEKDAKDAVKIYEKAYEGNGKKFLNYYKVERSVFPKDVRRRCYQKYYNSLDEFINDDERLAEYVEYIGADGLAQLLKEKDTKNVKSKDELRIIERMLEEYSVQLEWAKRDNLMQETIQKLEENVEYLKNLRDEKVGFTN